MNGWFAMPEVGVSMSHVLALSTALLFSTLIGLEREWNMKDAGLRTHSLVGVASALIMIVSKYGFYDILSDQIVLDPARVAAQIVSGIGFIGGGLIFVHRDVVRGLTTAAAIWLTAAIGMSCGAGMISVAFYVTAAYFLVVVGYTALAQYMINEQAEIQVDYEPHHEVVSRLARACASWGFFVKLDEYEGEAPEGLSRVLVRVSGRRDVRSLMITMRDIPHVQSVTKLPLIPKPLPRERIE